MSSVRIPKYIYMIDYNFHVTGPLWGESTDDQWIPVTKGQ